MEIIRQITAKTRACDVIDSCENMTHCNGAENYVRFYYSLFEDRLGFEELKRRLYDHKNDLLKPKINS